MHVITKSRAGLINRKPPSEIEFSGPALVIILLSCPRLLGVPCFYCQNYGPREICRAENIFSPEISAVACACGLELPGIPRPFMTTQLSGMHSVCVCLSHKLFLLSPWNRRKIRIQFQREKNPFEMVFQWWFPIKCWMARPHPWTTKPKL